MTHDAILERSILGRAVARTVSSKATQTITNLDIYVSPNGDDHYDGLSPDKPVKTLIQAVSLIPDFIKHPVTIHLASGTYDWAVIHSKNLTENITVLGDGAGQTGDDGFTELEASTAAVASSSQTQVVSAGGLGVNTYRGKTIEILTGAAAGDRRTIQKHTDTIITPVRQFSAAVGIGDTFRVLEPAVEIVTVDNPVLASGLGHSGVTMPQSTATSNPSQSVFPGLALINLKIKQVTPNTLFRLQFPNCRILMYGCEAPASTVRFAGNVSVGGDVASMWFSELGVTLTGGSKTRWAGWGLHAAAGLVLIEGSLQGYFVSIGLTQVNAGDFYMAGGNLEQNSGSSAALAAISGMHQKIVVGNFSTFVGITPLITNLGAAPAVEGNVGTSGNGGMHIAIVRATLASAGRCLQMRGSGVAVVASSPNVTGSGAVGIDSSYGARTFVAGACGLLGAAGNDLTTNTGSTFSAVATLSAAGTAVVNSTNGSSIVRQN